MPVYNAQAFLKKAIDSVLSQTFENFEFIIVNDGSKDNSEKIILSFNDPRIKYIHQENTGIGGALIKGCTHATGKYIARMDADDICISNRLELQYNFLEKNNTIILVSSAVIYIDDRDNVIGRSFPYTSDHSIKNMLKQGSTICHPAVMMKREAYIKAGGYNDLIGIEDLYLWKKMSEIGNFYNFSIPLIKYRVSQTSISRSIKKDDYKKIINILFDKTNKGVLSQQDTIMIKEMYISAKEVRDVNSISFELTNLNLNNNIELKLMAILSFFKLRESVKERIICFMKNIFGLIK